MKVHLLSIYAILSISTPALGQNGHKQAIENEATSFGIDPQLAVAIAIVESGLNQNAIGSKGEIGLFQLRPHLFPQENLKDPKTNIRLGLKHLSYWKVRCPVKDHNAWITCFNQGYRSPRFPQLLPYYKKVMLAKESIQ